MPAVVSIKVEKTVTGPVMGSGGPEGFNDPFGQFNDDFLRRFFGGRVPQQQRAPRKYPRKGRAPASSSARMGTS